MKAGPYAWAAGYRRVEEPTNPWRTPRLARESAAAPTALQHPSGALGAEAISEDTQADTATAPGIVMDVENPS